MLKRLISFGTLGALAFTPLPALAQDSDSPAVSEATQDLEADAAAEVTPAKPISIADVDYDVAVDPENILVLDLSSGKRVMIRLMPEWAPRHIERIKTLTRQGFYDGVIFHRVIDGFMAQTGDPTGTGQGGSQLPDLEEEFNRIPHLRGTVSMARANTENSANSQFFITFYPRFSLDRRYTNFGRVISGIEAVDEINRGEPPANPTRILQASIAADNKPAPLPAQSAPSTGTITGDMLSTPIN